MARITQEIAMSVPFRFSIGPDKKEFWMHRAIVSQQSPALDRLVNSGFKEGQDFHAELDWVDEKTFSSFWRFAYGGDYSLCLTKDKVAQDEIVPICEAVPEPESEPGPGPVPDDDWGGGWGNKKKKKATSLARSTMSILSDLQKFKEYAGYGNPPKPASNQPNGDSTAYTRDLFISHARVFVFADYYGVFDLCDISFYKLGEALVDYPIKDDSRVEDAVDVLRYSFEEDRPERLRYLMVLYAACKIDSLIKNAAFCELLEQHGEISTAVIRAMVNQLE